MGVVERVGGMARTKRGSKRCLFLCWIGIVSSTEPIVVTKDVWWDDVEWWTQMLVRLLRIVKVCGEKDSPLVAVVVCPPICAKWLSGC